MTALEKPEEGTQGSHNPEGKRSIQKFQERAETGEVHLIWNDSQHGFDDIYGRPSLLIRQVSSSSPLDF
jgi:hypothetical protein